MIRTLIVDDEPPARDQVREFLADEPDVLVVGESGDGQEALRHIRTLQPELLLMDIRMPSLSGLEVLRSGLEAPLPYTIFTTAYASYAVEAFALEALDYLLKPLERRRFHEAVDRARRYLARDASLSARLDRDALGAFIAALEVFGETPRRGRMPIKIGRRIRLLELERVEFMRADGDYVTIQQRDGEALRTRDSIAALETRLPFGRFLRVHRSVIVNLECVKELRSNKRGGYTLITAGDHRLATGATYAAAVQAILMR